MFKTLLLFVALFILASQSVYATHIVGGEIYYECLGDNQYIITLKVYRDCINGEAPFDDPASIGVYNSSGGLVANLQAFFEGSEMLEVVINNPCLQAPPNVCVEEAVYTVEANLPFIAGGYHVAYQRCCRNGSIVNIVNPGAQGSTYYVQIPEEALNNCNSSPYFNNFPPVALCIGDQLVFNHSATDPDGDQLVYSLCPPLHGGSQADPAPSPPNAPPYVNINWAGGYSAANPIDANPQFAIDPVTGELTGTPTQEGQYVVGICVEEFRNGQLVSTNNRDFQFNVVSCESGVDAIIPAQEVFHDLCDGLEVEFGNISINTEFYHWDFGVDVFLNDTSDLEFPIYTFPDTGIYLVTLIANPGYTCADTADIELTIYGAVVANILLDGEACFDVNSFNFEATGEFGNGSTLFWEFENGQPPTSTQTNPQGIVFDTLGTSNISLTIVENACSDQAQEEITTYLRPGAFFEPQSFSGCVPLTIVLFDSSLAETNYGIIWDFGDGHTATQPALQHTYTDTGTFDLSLTIWTTTGCIDTSVFSLTGAVRVNALPTGKVTVNPEVQSIFSPDFQFFGTSDDAVSCTLIPLPGESDNAFWAPITGCEFQYTYSDTGTFYPQMNFTDESGCVFTDVVRVRVEPEVRFFLPNAFTPNDDKTNDTWGAKTMGWKTYDLWVFDRWGKEFFHTSDPDYWWNGRLNNTGNLNPVLGVYVYQIRASSVKHTHINQTGHVTIVK